MVIIFMTKNIEYLDFELFEKMDAFWFTYYSINHPEDIDRTFKFFNNSGRDFIENVMMYCDMFGNYELN